jgi:uncharacterized protein with GYD domain
MFATLRRSSVVLTTAAVCSSGVALHNLHGSNSFFANCAAKNFSKTVMRPSRSPLVNLKDKVVLITGSTAGIGLACAWRFADEGSKLILVGRREGRLQEIKEALQQTYPGLKVHTVALSVTDYDAVSKLPNQLPSEFRDVDILVNNAGLARGVTSVETNQMKDAIEVMETNVLGTIAFTTAFTPGMKERGRGHVVNMGSVAVKRLFFDFFLSFIVISKKNSFHRDTGLMPQDPSTMPLNLPSMVSLWLLVMI